MPRKLFASLACLALVILGTAGMMNARRPHAALQQVGPVTSPAAAKQHAVAVKDCEEEDDDEAIGNTGAKPEHGSAKKAEIEDDDKIEHKCGKDDGELEDGPRHSDQPGALHTGRAQAAKP